MTAAEIAEFRDMLELERRRVASTIASLGENGPRAAEAGDVEEPPAARSVDLADIASITVERELGQGLEEGAQQALEQIDRALAKLDDGTFGLCVRCGKPIGAERIRARPWADLCIDDQRIADRG